MQLYRYKIEDIIYDPYNIGIDWIRESDINPAIYRNKISGSITFGSDFYDVINGNTTDVYWNFKIEQLKLSDSSWNLIYEGYFDRRYLNIDENKKRITISKIASAQDDYDKIQKLYDIQVQSTLIESPNVIYGGSETSVVLYCDKNAGGAGLTPAQYQAAYDVDANALQSAVQDPRWAYFIFAGNDAGGIPTFHTMAFTFRPAGYGYNLIDIQINGYDQVKRWVKLPPIVGATETYSIIITPRATDIGTFIDNMLSYLATGLNFNSTTDVSSTILMDAIYIANARSLVFEWPPFTRISLKQILDGFQDGFNWFWYVESGNLKFIHPTDFFNGYPTLDLTSETINNKRLSPIESSIPDIETFRHEDSRPVNDSTFSNHNTYEIEYDLVNFTEPLKREYNSGLYTNVPALMQNEIESDEEGFVLLEIDRNALPSRYITFYTGSIDTYNGTLGMQQLGLLYLSAWRYWNKSYGTGSLKTGYTLGTRPLYRLDDVPIQLDNDEILTDFETRQKVTTSAGECKIFQFKCDLRTNKKTLTLDLI